jgi:pilus assembly protein Flp/PilA
MRKMLGHFVRDEAATTAIEYGLIAAGISIAIVATVGLIGDQLVALFTAIATALTPPAP